MAPEEQAGAAGDSQPFEVKRDHQSFSIETIKPDVRSVRHPWGPTSVDAIRVLQQPQFQPIA